MMSMASIRPREPSDLPLDWRSLRPASANLPWEFPFRAPLLIAPSIGIANLPIPRQARTQSIIGECRSTPWKTGSSLSPIPTSCTPLPIRLQGQPHKRPQRLRTSIKLRSSIIPTPRRLRSQAEHQNLARGRFSRRKHIPTAMDPLRVQLTMCTISTIQHYTLDRDHGQTLGREPRPEMMGR